MEHPLSTDKEEEKQEPHEDKKEVHSEHKTHAKKKEEHKPHHEEKKEHVEPHHEKKEEHKPHHYKHHEEKKEHAVHKPHKQHEEGMWKNLGTWRFIAIIAAILLIISIFTSGFNFNGNTVKTTLSEAEAVQRTVDFVDANLLQPGLSATVLDSSDVGDLYQVQLSISGQQFDSYMTKDGRLLFPQGFDLLNEPQPLQQPDLQPVRVADVSEDDDPVKGDANAPVTIIEFSDFQCPFCERFFTETLSQIDEQYIKTGKVKLVYRDFPLDNIHPQATPAAEAAECADEQGKFYEYHDLLFENQRELSVDNFKKWAADLGLDEEQFNDCVDTRKYKDEVQKDLAEGSAAGVTGTPAFFVNGKSISGAQPFTVFEAMIEAELNTEESGVGNEVTTSAVAVPIEEPVKESVSLTAKKFRFVPNELTVTEGATVELSIASDDVDFGFELSDFGVSLDLVPGETSTAEFVADKSGEFTFSCSGCGKEEIMVGTLVVE